MKTLKAILVDDEKPSLQNLQQKLLEFCPDVQVVATVQKPEETLALIRKYEPDVLFLDIEMPRMNGFKLLESLQDIHFDIVFTTAYDHYAIDAIRISAFDYLIKPVAVKELQNCINRLLQQYGSQAGEKLDVLRQSLWGAKSQDDKIAVPINEGFEFLQIKTIIRIESSSSYSRIFFVNGSNMLVTRLLKDFEEILLPYKFFRVHNSHLINLNYVKKYIRGDGGQVVMENMDVIDVARRKKDEFLQWLHH